jgi:WD40 repeat protein
MAEYEAATVRVRCWRDGRPTTAGLGLLIGAGQVVTCAHVVNMALGRRQDEQAAPGGSDVVQVEFPLLPGAPVRDARVVAWRAPGGVRAGGGDVAGLALTEDAPTGAVPARFTVDVSAPGTWLRVFGYPGDPPRPDGAFVDVDLKGQVGGQMLQVESRTDQTVRAQPGFSGSPAWNPVTGEAAGLLQVAPQVGQPLRDARLLPPAEVAAAWDEPFDYLLIPENPYRGLEPFTAAHSSVFFGRNDDIRALTERVRAQPVTVVVGPSGVGKSSLVQAGLIPELGGSWSVTLVRPGQDPWLRLAAGLLRTQHGPQEPVTQAECQEEIDRLQAEGLGPTAEFLRSQDCPLLLVVDQFEEALAAGGAADLALLDLLLPEPGTAAQAARVVLTLRADYQPVLQSIPGLHPRLNDRLYLLSPLTRQQISDAVRRPAATRGVDFEPGLADQIVADAADGALPVLEFTLTQLWCIQRRKTLTFAGYHAMGGVRGALNRFADQQAAQLGDTVAELLDRVLLRLVRVPVGSPELTTRQRAWKYQIPDVEWRVLQRLAAARLVVQDVNSADGEPYAELAHETLITAWQRLAQLVAGNSEFLAWLAWARQRATDKDPLPEERIPEARHWADTRPGDIPPDVAEFIHSSETAVEARLRELRDARDQAEASRERADSVARRAEALRLAAEAELALRASVSPMTIALALSAESVLAEPTLQGDIALRHVLRLHPVTVARLGHGGTVWVVAFSPDGTRVATGSEDGLARVLDSRSGTELARLDHGGPVRAVAFSPDGTRVATGSEDGLARVFDARSGQELARLDHGGLVQAVAFSPDGTLIATGSLDGSARVFDARSGQELARLDHGGPVYGVAFSPDGTLIATGGGNRSAQVFDARSGQELARLDHGGPVRAVAFSPDGIRVATGSLDGSARVFDARSGAELGRLDHGRTVRAVAFSPDGTRVATGSLDGSARVFDARSGQELARLDHDGPVRSVAFSPDGTLIATGSEDWSARVFDPRPGAELARLGRGGPVRALAFSPDGARVATGSGDGLARVFDARSGQELARLDHGGPVRAVAFSPDGARVATGSGDGSARVFDARSGQELARLDHGGPVHGVAFSPDGARVTTGSGDGSARVFDARSGQELARLDHDGPVRAVAFSPDGARVATGSGDGSARVFDARSGQELARLNHRGTVHAVVFSPDGTRVATGSGNRSARVFDARSGAELTRLDHGGTVQAVAFSPDGTQVAAGSRDGSARVFDARSGAELTRLDHGGPVRAVVFSPDGTRVAAGSGDGSAREFDARSGQELARLDHSGPVWAVAFSPDGTRVATGSEDGSARISGVVPELLLRQAYRVMSRPLTEAELRRYSLASDCRHVARWKGE